MTFGFADQNRSAVLQLPAGSLGERRAIECTFGEMRGTRLTVECSLAVPSSTPVTIQYEDALYLGEVVRNVETTNSWELHIAVEQILSGLQSLMALRQHLMVEVVANPLGALPVAHRN